MYTYPQTGKEAIFFSSFFSAGSRNAEDQHPLRLKHICRSRLSPRYVHCLSRHRLSFNALSGKHMTRLLRFSAKLLNIQKKTSSTVCHIRFIPLPAGCFVLEQRAGQAHVHCMTSAGRRPPGSPQETLSCKENKKEAS
jgi:hypothetical protein